METLSGFLPSSPTQDLRSRPGEELHLPGPPAWHYGYGDIRELRDGGNRVLGTIPGHPVDIADVETSVCVSACQGLYHGRG